MQCQWTNEQGRCQSTAQQGVRFCNAHAATGEQMEIGQYLISKKMFGDAPERHMEANEIKSLKAEIALLRALVEKRLNMINTDAEFVAAMPTLKDSFLAVEKLVSSCHNMEHKLGELLGKQALLAMAQKIVRIINLNLEGIPDKDETVEKIGLEIAATIKDQIN